MLNYPRFFESAAISGGYLIHENLSGIVKKRPKSFDASIYKDMHQLLVLTTDEFKQQRSHQHLSKLVYSLYFIRKKIRNSITSLGRKRHVRIHLIKTDLKFPFGVKSVLGIVMGISLLDNQEIFEEKHLLLAMRKFSPDIQIVKDSVYIHPDPQEGIRTLYMEVEKKEGGEFLSNEIQVFKKYLPNELQARVEKLVPSLFMNRNEEEIMKNILLLNKELTSINDLPQMIIQLESQSKNDLTFIVVLVRVIPHFSDGSYTGSDTIEKYFQSRDSSVSFTLERRQIIGYLHKNYPKEANVFRITLSYQADFLRPDCSINFYLARQKIVSFISGGLGDVRDYNGGMILQQVEQLDQLKKRLPEIDPSFIEEFFYSMTPIERQVTIEVETLEEFFLMFFEISKERLVEKDTSILRANHLPRSLFIVIKAENAIFKKHLKEALGSFELNYQLTHALFDYQGVSFFGYFYNDVEVNEKQRFLKLIKKSIELATEEIKKRQVLRLALRNLPVSLDPRIGGDEDSRSFLKMLFEGLIRIGKDGSIGFALAESLQISQDEKQYVFKLRHSCWSNGDPLVAFDFEYGWKSILMADVNSRFASLFYLIKNAKKAKQGLIPQDDIGIKAADENTLIVELEYPAPYFLELLDLPLFSPIHHKIDQTHPNWSLQDGDAYVCNGPFRLRTQSANCGYLFEKNPMYWDESAVSLEEINICKTETRIAYEMFKNDELDWVGRTLPFWEPYFAKSCKEKIESRISPKVSWCVFNTQQKFLNHVKIRQALTQAIDRKKMLTVLELDASPAMTPVPLPSSQCADKEHLSWDAQKVNELLRQGLDELKVTRDQLPVFRLAFPMSDVIEKMALFIKQSWESTLGIKCILECYNWSTLFAKICEGDYSMSLIIWTSWINDPIYSLNAFGQDDHINFSKWKDDKYRQLLNAANNTRDRTERLEYLKRAEEILMDQVPVCPIFFEKFHYLKKHYVNFKGNFENGCPDFKQANILR